MTDTNAVEVLEAANTKRNPRINFKKMGIPIGAKLTFANSDITAEVADESNKVKYNGELTSLSSITKELVGLYCLPNRLLVL